MEGKCPWKDQCFNHPGTCSGSKYWCGWFDTKDDQKKMDKAMDIMRKEQGNGKKSCK